MTDVAMGWSERVAILGRGQQAMEAGFRLILSRLPQAFLAYFIRFSVLTLASVA